VDAKNRRGTSSEVVIAITLQILLPGLGYSVVERSLLRICRTVSRHYTMKENKDIVLQEICKLVSNVGYSIFYK